MIIKDAKGRQTKCMKRLHRNTTKTKYPVKQKTRIHTMCNVLSLHFLFLCNINSSLLNAFAATYVHKYSAQKLAQVPMNGRYN